MSRRPRRHRTSRLDSAGRFASSSAHDEEWEALARFITGESSAEEAEAISRRLSEHPEDAALIARLAEVTEQLARSDVPALPVTDADTERALRAMRLQLPKERALAPRYSADIDRPVRLLAFQPHKRRTTVGWRGVALAAAAVLVVAVGIQRWRTRTASNAVSDRGTGTAPTFGEFTTRVGERDSIRLADGTRVLLGPGSRLSVPVAYGRSHREVELRGEAYIEVVHDSARPFVVRAGTATIIDVGTKFSVHGDDNAGVRVVVTEGVVELGATAAPRDEGTLLHAGDVGVLVEDGTVMAERGTATEDDLAWTRGRLVFRNATMNEVRADLRRWYGIELVFADSTLLTRHFSNAFVDDSATRVVQVIGMTLGVPVTTRGDTAVIGAAPEATRRK